MTKPECAGFTLLEVLVALFIAALALSSIMALSGSSKRLALKAQLGLDQVLYERAALNAAYILNKPEYPEYPEDYADNQTLQRNDPLPRPAQQTVKILYVLEPYEIQSKHGEFGKVAGLRWQRLQTLPN